MKNQESLDIYAGQNTSYLLFSHFHDEGNIIRQIIFQALNHRRNNRKIEIGQENVLGPQ